jgi:ribosomal protein L37AE/L43A
VGVPTGIGRECVELPIEQQQEAARAERLAEVGTEPACPFCGRPRVTRSTYIRCNRCGLNWGEGQSVDRHPLATQPIVSTAPETKDSGALTARFISEGGQDGGIEN